MNRYETVLPDQLRRRYRSPQIQPPYIRPKAKIEWAVLIAAVAGLAVAGISLISVPRETISSPPATSSPSTTPAPEPTLVPIPAVEVRKAGYVLHRQVIMPDKTTLMTRYLGSVPNQESLPLSGNHIGDAYSVGTYEFVWVAPGLWIDPVN